MTTVFIAGSIAISRLHEKVKARIEKIVDSDLDIVVGDADGADSSIQECLLRYGAKRVKVYCSGDRPRNNLADWPVSNVYPKASPGSRAFYTAKDLEMAHASNYGLMIWDCKSTGTLSNVIELIKEEKKSVVFVNKNKEFLTVADADGLSHLLSFMSDHARAKAEEKIGLSSKIAAISQQQFSLPIKGNKSKQRPSVAHTAAVEDADPAHPANMKLRSTLMQAIERHVQAQGWTQTEAARRLGVTPQRISDLLLHKTGVFGLDSLVNMVEAAGLHIEVRVAA
ncbi:helix-turn-helix domain-containing protein [Mesorhizobium sp. M1312]|uniref:helix-turn-helix domain-containing protein n=1 Tax=unclassified Mesorhizobium TaxID=325217 RepID=UPI003336591D